MWSGVGVAKPKHLLLWRSVLAMADREYDPLWNLSKVLWGTENLAIELKCRNWLFLLKLVWWRSSRSQLR